MAGASLPTLRVKGKGKVKLWGRGGGYWNIEIEKLKTKHAMDVPIL